MKGLNPFPKGCCSQLNSSYLIRQFYQCCVTGIQRQKKTKNKTSLSDIVLSKKKMGNRWGVLPEKYQYFTI